MTLQQFLLILWARRKLVLFTFLGTVLTATVVTLLLPEHLVPKPTQRHFWLVPPVALAGCVFLMRALLLA